MVVLVNNQPVAFASGQSLYTLLLQLELIEKNGIAVAVNSRVIPKSKWEDFDLTADDNVMIIHATQGG